MRKSGVLGITATAVDAIHHGRGVVGNVQMLRVQEIVSEDGDVVRVPYISGNSIKHMVREYGVRFALDAMGVEDGTLTKSVVDLLFSGGHLSKASASLNIGMARKVADLFPILSLCGYSAGNFMQSSKMSVSNWHLVCEENVFRIPKEIADHAHLTKRAALFCGNEFGTRHEATKTKRAFSLLTDGEKRRIDTARSEALDTAKKACGRVAVEKPKDSSQMIYEFETVLPGSMFCGSVSFSDLDEMELAAFRSAFARACLGKHGDAYLYAVGAKSSIGLGRVAVRFSGAFRDDVKAPDFTASEDVLPAKSEPEDGDAYVDHLREKKTEILSMLNGIMS